MAKWSECLDIQSHHFMTLKFCTFHFRVSFLFPIFPFLFLYIKTSECFFWSFSSLNLEKIQKTNSNVFSKEFFWKMCFKICNQRQKRKTGGIKETWVREEKFSWLCLSNTSYENYFLVLRSFLYFQLNMFWKSHLMQFEIIHDPSFLIL
jgi:hypothetical protein